LGAGELGLHLTAGVVYSIIFLSITLVTGMSGQVSLCQATFAGIGAFVAAQLAVHHGVPILLGALSGRWAPWSSVRSGRSRRFDCAACRWHS